MCIAGITARLSPAALAALQTQQRQSRTQELPSPLKEGWKQMGRKKQAGGSTRLWDDYDSIKPDIVKLNVKKKCLSSATERYLERCSSCPAGSRALLPLLSRSLFQPCGLSLYAAWQPREVSLGEGQAPHGLPSRVHQAMTLSACTWHLSLLFLFWEEEKQLSSATVCEGGRWGVNSVVIVLLICLAWKWRTHDRTTRNKHGGVWILNSIYRHYFSCYCEFFFSFSDKSA